MPSQRPTLKLPSSAAAAFFLTIVMVIAPGNCDAYSQDADAERNSQARLPFEWYVAGTVEDEHGERVAGAFVTAFLLSGERRSTTSDDNGRFVLSFRSARRSGFPMVIRSCDMSLGTYIGGFDFDHTMDRRLFRAVLRPTRKVTVSVQDDKSGVVANAIVDVIADYRTISTAHTDNHGQAVLRLSPDDGIDWITARKGGMGFDYYENYASYPTQQRLTVPDAVRLTLNGARTVEVKVVDTKGIPVSGVGIVPWLFRKVGKIANANLSGNPNLNMTDEEGIANFKWVPKDHSGQITFLAHHPKYRTVGRVHCGPEDTAVVAKVERMATVSGRVTDDQGSPVSGVHVQGEGSRNGHFRRHTITAADGTYRLDVHPQSDTIVAVTEQAYAAESLSGVSLNTGENRDHFDFTLIRGTLIHGKVTVGSERRPAVSDTATLIQLAGVSRLVQWKTTDGEGHYEFRVGPGRYELSFQNAVSVKPKHLRVEDQQEIVHDVHFARRARIDLTGTAVDESGNPLAGCLVYAEPIESHGGNRFVARTDATGRFETLRKSVRMAIYARHDKLGLAGRATISEDDESFTVKLRPSGSVAGVVRDGDGKPVPNQSIQLTMDLGLKPSADDRIPADARARSLNIFSQTDEAGEFVLHGISPDLNCHIDVIGTRNGRDIGPDFKVQAGKTTRLDDLILHF